MLVSQTTPITKDQVLTQFNALGITTLAQFNQLMREPRQYEASNPALLPGEASGPTGNTDMITMLQNLATINNLQYVSRRHVRHLLRLLYKEGSLGF